ncbi:MAG TPA: periplasmic heavy metal sensor [Candidatus Binatia bacterium]|nr:periplasmic heavy metal sensor [Candidatus Binatia bacterium]
MNRTLKIILLISLIANVLLLGVVLGAVPRRLEARPSFRDRVNADIEKLPEPARTRMRENMEQTRKADESTFAEIRQAREEALKIIAAEPFDEAAYDLQVNRISELRRGMFQHMSDNIKAIVKTLPPEQRKAVADLFRRPPPGTS